jgi:uncharacterized protein DUF3562
MANIYDESNEEAVHLDAMESLAEEANRPLAEVKRLYERELMRLKPGARVRDYLVVLASRRVRDRLSRRGGNPRS